MTTRIYGSWFVLASFLLLSSRLSYVTAQYVRQAIVGGSPVTTAYPFLAFSSGYELCGATLIWSDILLSAGHCVDAFLNNGVFIGGISLSGGDGEFHAVARVLVHPDYPAASTQPNDIMLVQIATSSSLPPVTLATNTDLPVEGSTVTVVGYGNTEYGSVSPFAKQVDLSVVNLTACDELYGGKVIDAQFCTDGNGDSCQGDSGGPLLNSNGEQVGIVSFGEGCDQYPSVNTRVSSYSAWIQEGICSLSSSPPTACPATVSVPTLPTGVPIPAPTTTTPTFRPIPLLTAAPITTAAPVAATLAPVATPSPTTARSDPPSDGPSTSPTMMPSVTIVVNTTSPSHLPLNAEETTEAPGVRRPSAPPEPLESAEAPSPVPPVAAAASSGARAAIPFSSHLFSQFALLCLLRRFLLQ